ncbi:ferredoxin [Parabacteroides bouchesdurhonensis]|nr:ferredoxin [Parabacteroides bouchesdurhonensis]RHJ93673.1 ferredoxin [Bacteroides sp. AM07-16]
MSISKVWIEDGCIACGNCEAVCPEVFFLTDHSNVKEGVDFGDFEAGIKQAAEECPVEVIKYE